jgi:hypothetical protein
MARVSLGMGMTHDGQRDTWSIFGYPDKITIKDFRDKYKRGDIATRIVDAYPNECWSCPPLIVEDSKEQDRTAWESDVDTLLEELDFWQKIRKLDILVNLGKYAVLYIGFSDGKDLSEPVLKGTKPIYVKPLAEDVAVIKTFITDPQNKRFGLPETYELTLSDTVGSQTEVKRTVHYSRVLHVAERTLDKEYEGQSVLEPIWNKLIDLEKVSGGSAEVFWLNARGGMALEAEADADLGSAEDKEALKKEIEAYQHNLTRTMRTKGFTIKPIVQKVESPKDQFDICISIIAGTTAIPKRILLGNEAGELASSQDETNWSKQIKNRQKNFCESHILNVFIDYMIELNLIKTLDKGKAYEWEWPSLTNISNKDKAEIATKLASAIATYANSVGADSIIPPKQFVEDVLELEYREDEINKIIEEENAAIDKSLEENPIVKLPVVKLPVAK